MGQRKHLVNALLCTALLCATACDPSSDEFDPVCDAQLAYRNVGGRWSVTGEGQRSGCSDPRLNGDLVVAMDPFDVVAYETTADAGVLAVNPDSLSEADAFVERILRADHQLQFSNKPDELEFVGSTNGSCVNVTIEEDLGAGKTQSITFEASIRDDGVLKAYFDGFGPGSCEMDGKITVDIR